MAQGDEMTLMRSEEVRIRIINNTYATDLEQRTAAYLNAQGMQVVEFGPPTGASNTTKIILYSSKLYALRYLTELIGVRSQQIIIQPDPASTVDIEIRLGEDWVGRVPSGY